VKRARTVKGHRNKLYQFCKLYAESEIEFLEFEKTVPYSIDTARTYSPKLRPILQTVCTDIEGILKFLTRFLKLKPAQEKLEFMFKELNSKNMLSIQKVSHRECLITLTPFTFTTKVPPWWTAYNQTKHNLPDGVKCATMGNTINALGALLILLQTSRILIELDDNNWIMDSNNWNDNEKSFYESYRRLQYSLATNVDFMDADRNYFYSKQRIFHSGLFYYLSECKNTITEEMRQ
jgi:hypothetical protein